MPACTPRNPVVSLENLLCHAAAPLLNHSFPKSMLPNQPLHGAGNILAQHGAGDKLRKCWGVGIRRNTEQLQAQMQVDYTSFSGPVDIVTQVAV